MHLCLFLLVKDKETMSERNIQVYTLYFINYFLMKEIPPPTHTHTEGHTQQTDPALPVTSSSSHWLAVVQEERCKHKLECVCGGLSVCSGRPLLRTSPGNKTSNILRSNRAAGSSLWD